METVIVYNFEKHNFECNGKIYNFKEMEIELNCNCKITKTFKTSNKSEVSTNLCFIEKIKPCELFPLTSREEFYAVEGDEELLFEIRIQSKNNPIIKGEIECAIKNNSIFNNLSDEDFLILENIISKIITKKIVGIPVDFNNLNSKSINKNSIFKNLTEDDYEILSNIIERILIEDFEF